MSHDVFTSALPSAYPRRRRGLLVGTMITAALLAGTSTVAHGEPPVRQPPANATFEIHVAAGDVPCGGITITFTDHERYTTFTSGVTLVTGRLDAVVTSDVTGRSVSLQVSGPGKFLPDGTITGGGPWLLFSSEVLAYAAGRITIPGGDVNVVQVKGTRTDLCPLLGL